MSVLVPGPLKAALAAVLLGLAGCRPGLPVLGSDPADGEAVNLRTYRDSLLDLDLGYPEGWTFTDKTTFTLVGRSVDTYFEPQETQWTHRFTVKVVTPDRLPNERMLDEFREEYQARLLTRASTVRIADTGWSTLGGRPAWRARYDVLMDGKPFTRHTDYLSVKDGRDFSLAYEVSADHADPVIVLSEKIAERFRHYRP